MDSLQTTQHAVVHQEDAHTHEGRHPVHPGWLVADAAASERARARHAEDATRFAAFLQLIRTAGAVDRAATDVLADLELTAGAFGALLELGEAEPVGLAPSELARRLAVARRTATLYVDILQRQGWADRRPHPDDRRMVLARLTPVGRRLLDEVGEAYQRRLAALLCDMTPLQAERLRQLLATICVDEEPRSHHGHAAERGEG
ncbi:MAG TPA: MarR family transcriptional regulator [Thermomicrobiales bacterium]|nr:MarR family transcriptional regulator [Thermomicrobiales bacterium]